MKKLSIFLSFIILLMFTYSVNAQTIEIFVTNSKTAEKKTYEIGNNIISIPVNFVKGWDKCTANAMKKYKFYGNDMIRGELYCTTEKNTTMSISCVASKNGIEITIATLYDVSFKLIDKENIGANAYAEIILTCKNN
jgi:hypothetical protein